MSQKDNQCFKFLKSVPFQAFSSVYSLIHSFSQNLFFEYKIMIIGSKNTSLWVLRMLQKCFKNSSKILQKSFKNHSKMLQECFKSTINPLWHQSSVKSFLNILTNRNRTAISHLLRQIADIIYQNSSLFKNLGTMINLDSYIYIWQW